MSPEPRVGEPAPQPGTSVHATRTQAPGTQAPGTQALGHEHPVDEQRVAAARAGLLSPDEAGRLAGLLGMLADPVRSRILFALAAAGELCVGDLGLALDVTQDQVTYALKLLRFAGLVSYRKAGRMVFYRLSDGFPHPLLEHCLRQLLTIAAPEAHDDRP